MRKLITVFILLLMVSTAVMAERTGNSIQINGLTFSENTEANANVEYMLSEKLLPYGWKIQLIDDEGAWDINLDGKMDFDKYFFEMGKGNEFYKSLLEHKTYWSSMREMAGGIQIFIITSGGLFNTPQIIVAWHK